MCSVLPPEAAVPKSPSGAFAGILRISREILRIIRTHECDPWFKALPRLPSPTTGLPSTSH